MAGEGKGMGKLRHLPALLCLLAGGAVAATAVTAQAVRDGEPLVQTR